ncbi:MAG TPA: DUF1592 domain-containing protein [Nannocystis sp.]|jgi:hypothetical protein
MQRSDLTLGALALAFGLASSACYDGATLDSGSATATSTGSEATAADADGGGDSGSGATGDAPPALPEVPAPTSRRLTTAEFKHSVTDLLGPVTLSAIEADASQEGFFSVGNARIALSPAGVALYEKALEAATLEAFADPARVPTIVACVPALPTDTVCLRDAIASFGRRAWRRPLAAAELDRYLGIATAVGSETSDAVVGLRHAVWGLLQSPHFLYRVELGAAGADGRVAFSSYEMASRLAFTLWNTLPDEALLDAAERDELTSADGVVTQATRMLADPRARQGVHNFIGELYELWLLDEKVKDPTQFPEWTPTLRQVMRDELLARIEDVVFTAPDDFFALYDSPKVFVNNELAALYGLPPADPDSFRAELLPEGSPRRGLIGSGLMLAMNSLPARTSATARGAFIAEALLCRTVPPPPPEVDTDLDKPDEMNPGPRTLREKLEPHRSNPACAGCHNITDPLGLALEHFDTVGRYRELDQGLVIDASGELDGMPFVDGAELASRLREHPEVARCLVKKLATYTAGRLPALAEFETLAALEDALAIEGNRFDRLLFALVTHDDFRFAHPPDSVIAPDHQDMGEMP